MEYTATAFVIFFPAFFHAAFALPVLLFSAANWKPASIRIFADSVGSDMNAAASCAIAFLLLII